MAKANSCADQVDEFNFPKAELHCHLDGTFRLETIIDLAKKRGIELPSYEPNELAQQVCCLTRKRNLAEYLAGFHVTTPTFAGCEDALVRITREAIEDKSRIGVRYIEFRYSPHLLANCDVTPMLNCKVVGNMTPRRVVEIICEAVEKAEKDFNVTCRLILCCILDFKDWSMEIAQFCKDFANRGVVAMDIAGDHSSTKLSIKDHAKAFQFCKDNGIHITVHAGEAGGSQEVSDAIRCLYAERIGHGYHVVDDEEVYADSKRRNIHFEVCPISSYRTASVSIDPTDHPATRFLKDDVNFSLSTDDDGFNQESLIGDYMYAAKNFKFSSEDIKKLNLNALRSAFCDSALKESLCKEFKEAYTA